MNKFFLIQLFMLISTFLYSQVPQQKIRGQVYDKTSRAPIAGAEVYLKNTDPILGAVTDEGGNFSIEEVPVGRYNLVVKFIGYTTYTEDILVHAAGQPTYNIGLEISYRELSQITVRELPFTVKEGINARSVTIEEATRFAANYLDPARVMTSFPGVVNQNDQNNNLVINGKSPNGVQWRLEGFDIINPNHLSNAGTLSDRPTQSGGGVNILSTQMLGKTTLVGLPFSAEYGNAYSGIMDMSFRDGNKYENKYTLQASLIGLDAAAEGPLKEGKSSFLANYRYSTVGLLTGMGVDFGGEEISFQDLSFKLSFDHKKGGSLSIFGFAGTSNNDFNGIDDPEEWNVDKDSTQVFYHSKISAVGVKDVRPISERTSLLVGAVLSSGLNDRKTNGLFRDGTSIEAETYESKNDLLSFRSQIMSNLSSTSEIKGGIMANVYDYSTYIAEAHTSRGEIINSSMKGILFQPFLQYKRQLASALSVDGGIRYMHYTYNGTDALLPNVRLNYSLNISTVLNVNYGWQAQIQSAEVYRTENQELEMSKIQHAGIGLNKFFQKGLLTSEIFYESLYDIPGIDIIPSSYLVINEMNDFTEAPLESIGTATIYGLNASYERPFENDLYYIFSGALYESTYEGSDGIKRNSRFNGNYSLSATGGKEFRKEKENGHVKITGLDTRILYSGGLRTSPIDEDLSASAQRTIFKDPFFSEQLRNYFRVDFRISWRKERRNYTRMFAIDIQNVFSIENDGFRYFDMRKNAVVVNKQLGIIPILVYRVEF
jgi:hypothetical protein